ncbi:hypothetical protein M2283_003942 [Streptomyces pseudovenezuelae]|uniref:Gas vesicle protein A n=1 Tax=Streptomyces pseudovenezuelae TaxID=67350 RepID=A0ABT6LKY0_9ACTN|nr:hypothetical protein [Streptomyces pseudovenezuelae]
MTVLAQTAAPRAQKTDGGLYDILDLILDRGLVIDVFIRVSVIGIEILRVDIRIVIASVDTYLRFAAATNRLDLENRGTPVVTPAPALFAPALPTAVAPEGQAAVAPGVAAAPAPGTVVMQGQPVTAWPSGTGTAVPVVGNLGQTVGQALGAVGQTVGGVVGVVTPTVGGLVQGVAPTVVGTVGRTAGTVVGAVAPAATTVVGSVVPAASGVSAVVPAAGTAAPVTDLAAHSAGEVGVVEQEPVRAGQESAGASVPPAAGHEQAPPVQTPAAEQAPAAAPGKPRGGKGQQGGEA